MSACLNCRLASANGYIQGWTPRCEALSRMPEMFFIPAKQIEKNSS
jgi:hypothetical protein